MKLWQQLLWLRQISVIFISFFLKTRGSIKVLNYFWRSQIKRQACSSFTEPGETLVRVWSSHSVTADTEACVFVHFKIMLLENKVRMMQSQGLSCRFWLTGFYFWNPLGEKWRKKNRKQEGNTPRIEVRTLWEMVEMPGDITGYQLTVPQGRLTPSIGFGTVVQHSVGPSVYFAELTLAWGSGAGWDV